MLALQIKTQTLHMSHHSVQRILRDYMKAVGVYILANMKLYIMFLYSSFLQIFRL